jgi:hypothetical protein
MQLNHKQVHDSQWQAYKRLESIPEFVPDPRIPEVRSVLGLGWLWRGLLHLLVDELVAEQQVEYLERCWELDVSGQSEKSPSNSLHRLWVLMD